MNITAYGAEIVGEDIPSETKKVTEPVKELTVYETAKTASPEHQKVLVELIEEYKQPITNKEKPSGVYINKILIYGGLGLAAITLLKG